jgi:hypothetical protein
MRINLLTLTALTILSTTTITLGANASCLSSNMYGYSHAYGTCTQNRTTSPKNVCEVSRDTTEIKNILFISNVAWDYPDHRTPSEKLSVAVQSAFNVLVLGTDSNCYKSEVEAESNRSEQIESYKKDGWLIREPGIGDDY